MPYMRTGTWARGLPFETWHSVGESANRFCGNAQAERKYSSKKSHPLGRPHLSGPAWSRARAQPVSRADVKEGASGEWRSHPVVTGLGQVGGLNRTEPGSRWT
ncbi:hypothetical protein Acsp05_53970 [Actinokineospora sp. NBRC 105648]|nr:hypothetical protein Acsp05_53970 [Actinokineospora sp. NBRC 105648]